MSYIDSLIADGTHFRMERKDGHATFRPAGETGPDLEAFQSVVRNLRSHQGDGYRIHREHEDRDHGRGLIDQVLVTIEQA